MWLSGRLDDYFETEWRRKEGGGPLLTNAPKSSTSFALNGLGM